MSLFIKNYKFLSKLIGDIGYGFLFFFGILGLTFGFLDAFGSSSASVGRCDG